MAGLIGLTASAIEIQDALRVGRWEFEGEWVPHPVVRLTTTLPAAVLDEGVPTVARVRWGVSVGGRPVGNARDDRLGESRMWRSMLGKEHAVFVATGIYEMTRSGASPKSSKAAWWFRRRDGHPILMPGLVSRHEHEGATRLSGAIVTTAPNAFFSRFHDRQVCALGPEDVEAWLAADREDALQMLSTPAPEDWEAVPVDPRIFGKGRREMEDLVPIGPPLHHTGPGAWPDDPGLGQQRLF